MQTQQLFIPDKINVGFQKRTDTYTGQLAYIIYFDKSGVLRKETSWQSWRDKKIDPIQFENTPTEGFVLNKGVGGARYGGWNPRNEYIRVYDPRDFEFEISLANLLFILKVGLRVYLKLEGKFVYAWDKNNLILLPAASQDYKVSASFTDLQDKKVAAKDLGQTAERSLNLNEMRRHAIVQVAQAAADEIIMAGSNGTPEETDYLTSAVAQVMNNRVHQANTGRLLRKQLFDERR